MFPVPKRRCGLCSAFPLKLKQRKKMKNKTKGRTNRSIVFGLLALVLMFGAGSSNSFANSNSGSSKLVLSEGGSDTDITVYGSSFAQIEETRTVSLSSGSNRIQLLGVSGQYTPDSLRIVNVDGPGAFEYKSATYQPANLNREEILRRSIGETISVVIGSGPNSKTVSGKLQAVSGSQLILVDSSGKTHITSSSNLTFDKLPSGLSSTASLVIEANVDVAGDYEVSFFYESRGFGWSAKHSLIYNEEARQLDDFQTTVNVVNNSGTTFSGANLWLLSGDVRQNAKGMARGSSYRLQMMDESSGASVESVGERKVYKIPGTVDLVAGQSRQIPIYEAQNVPVEKEFVLTSWDYQYRDSESLAPVKVRLNLKNCTLSNLGTPLPAATVKVYQANKNGNLQLTQTTSLKDLAIDESFAVDMGDSSDLKASVTMLKSQEVDGNGTLITGQLQSKYRGPRYRIQEWLIKVHNFKLDEDVEVTVRAQVPANLDNVSPFTRESAQVGTAKVKVLRTNSTELNYDFKVRVN